MELAAGRYRWNGAGFVPVQGPELELLVADSFLLKDGKVVAPERHRERFLRDAGTQGIVRPPEDFVVTAFTSLPHKGSWFPRLDLTERGELELWVRPAPELGETVTLWTAPMDPRTTPSIKGPDIAVLGVLRNDAKVAGASEAVIVDQSGHVVDGATTCLVWWRGDTLVTPHDAPRVWSVTQSVVEDMARAAGLDVESATVEPTELADAEVWALNALHGIRLVSEWIHGQSRLRLNADMSRLAAWRENYADRAVTL